MSRFSGPPAWKEDEPVSAQKLNDSIRFSVRNISAGPGLRAFRSGGNVALSLTPDNRPIFPIVRAKVTTAASEGNPKVFGVTPWDGTNLLLEELRAKLDASHAEGDDVLIIRPLGGTTETETNGDPIIWEELDFKVTVFVRVDSVVASAGGKYAGKIMGGGTFSDTGAGNLSLPDGLTQDGDCLIVNDDEDGQPTHWLTLGTYTEGVYGGMSTEATPRPIVRVLRGRYRTASPQTLAATGGGTGETAETDTWDRTRVTSGTDYGDVPLKVQVQTRTVYNATGDKVLYEFYRALTFAADGRLASVSAEARVVVDNPDTSCPS